MPTLFRSRLYEQQDQAYCSQFANIEQAAASQGEVLIGAPGSIIKHKRQGLSITHVNIWGQIERNWKRILVVPAETKRSRLVSNGFERG